MNPLTWIAWAISGNDDDGIYGDLNWNPDQEKTVRRAIRWWFRNPLHNLVFCVIGCAGADGVTREGPYPNDVFSPVGGWNRAATRLKRYNEKLCFILAELWVMFVMLSSYETISAWFDYLVRPFSSWWLLATPWLLVPVLLWLFYGTAFAFRIYGTMPFISYIGAVKFYIGWRERGNFGVKLTHGPGAR